MTKNFVSINPNAAMLIESMRSMGYSFETALADVIDNSISANANEINVYQRMVNGNNYIQIIDNGHGMNQEELVEAMRLGSKHPNALRATDDLGRFGLGLKSASFSQCRMLTVISKKDEEIHGLQWDLDLVEKSNEFIVRNLSIMELDEIPNIEYLHKHSSGTLVQWENFDRIDESTNDLQEELADLMNGAIEHIALIFHRFLDGSLKIYVNNEAIIPKDPFLTKNNGTQERPTERIKIEGEIVTLIPYVLPHLSKLTAKDRQEMGKTNDYYRSQGFYLYRNKRLIIWGSYLGISRKTELAKNLRIQVDIPNTLDYLWDIDVKKSRANVPTVIKKNLTKVIVDGEQTSKRIYKFRGKKEIVSDESMWTYVEDRDNEFHFEINPRNKLYGQLIHTLNDNQKFLLGTYLNILAETLPIQQIYAELADGKKIERYDDDKNFEEVRMIIENIKLNDEIDIKNALNIILSIPKYGNNKKIMKLIEQEMREYHE